MTIRQILTACCSLVPLLAAGCVSSEETGGGSRSAAPQPIFARIDTTRRIAQRPRPQISDSLGKKMAADSLRARRQPRPAPGVRAKRDTIEVSLVTRSRSSAAVPTDVVEVSNGNYTVQLGAFKSASNALRVQHTVKQRYANHVVLSEYDEKKELYRISVGQFPTLREATAFRRRLLTEHPKEYALCWVNYIR